MVSFYSFCTSDSINGDEGQQCCDGCGGCGGGEGLVKFDLIFFSDMISPVLVIIFLNIIQV